MALGARLLEEEQVAVVPGEGFGAPGYFRLSFASSLAGPAGGGATAWRSFFGRLPGGRAS